MIGICDGSMIVIFLSRSRASFYDWEANEILNPRDAQLLSSYNYPTIALRLIYNRAALSHECDSIELGQDSDRLRLPDQATANFAGDRLGCRMNGRSSIPYHHWSEIGFPSPTVLRSLQ